MYLFDKVGHGVTFVEEPQLPVGSRSVAGVHENSTVADRPVYVSHHGAYIPSSLWLAPVHWMLTVVEVLLELGIHVLGVALVNGVDLTL